MKENRLIGCAVYERPAVEVLEFAVERGFRVSDPYDEFNPDYNSDNGTLSDGGDWY